MNEDIVLGFDDLVLTKDSERCVLHAYPDPASKLGLALQKAGLWYGFLDGKNGIPAALRIGADGKQLSGAPWTIGWGHTGKEVVEGLVWTQQKADDTLVADYAWAQAAVRKLVTIKLSKEQFIACCDLVFNIGEENFRTSTLDKQLNSHHIAEAADQFRVWNRAGGKVNNGLIKRREAERALFILGSDFNA